MTVSLTGERKAGHLTLLRGSHATAAHGLCAMEAVAWLAGEPHSDAPDCACPVLAAWVRRVNDRWTDADRQRLIEYLPRLVGTRSPALEWARAWILVDGAVRELAPIRLELAGRADLAARLRGIAPIVDRATALAAREVTREVRRAAAAYAAAAAAAADAADAADAAAAAYAYAYAAYAAYAYAYAAYADAADAAAARPAIVIASLAILQRAIEVV